MAAGCWVVGYSGGGGRELFRHGPGESVAFGDFSAFIAAIQRAFDSFADCTRETNLRLHRQSLAIKSLYSFEPERLSIQAAWDRIFQCFQAWREDLQ